MHSIEQSELQEHGSVVGYSLEVYQSVELIMHEVIQIAWFLIKFIEDK